MSWTGTETDNHQTPCQSVTDIEFVSKRRKKRSNTTWGLTRSRKGLTRSRRKHERIKESGTKNGRKRQTEKNKARVG